jgi:hypothetical protein
MRVDHSKFNRNECGYNRAALVIAFIGALLLAVILRFLFEADAFAIICFGLISLLSHIGLYIFAAVQKTCSGLWAKSPDHQAS